MTKELRRSGRERMRLSIFDRAVISLEIVTALNLEVSRQRRWSYQPEPAAHD